MQRRIKAIDSTSFGPVLQGMLNSLDQSRTADQLAQDFSHLSTALMHVYAPPRESLQTIRPRKPWFNLEIKFLKRSARKMEKAWQQEPTQTNWINYKLVRNQYKNAIKSEKRKVISERIVRAQVPRNFMESSGLLQEQHRTTHFQQVKLQIN